MPLKPKSLNPSAQGGSASDKKAVSGFTMTELLVGMGLFAVVVTIAVGGFLTALRSERQAAALIAANSNVSLAIETMAREIRTGYDFAPDTAALSHQLDFRNALGESVTYCYDSVQEAILRSITGGACGGANYSLVTSNNIRVRDGWFVIQSWTNPSGDKLGRVTLGLSISSKDVSLVNDIFHLQTTISGRVFYN